MKKSPNNTKYRVVKTVDGDAEEEAGIESLVSAVRLAGRLAFDAEGEKWGEFVVEVYRGVMLIQAFSWNGVDLWCPNGGATS